MSRMRGTLGQAALPALIALIVVVTVALLVVARVGGAIADRTRARTAADAAALAGAHDGESAARELAERNGAELTAFTRVDDDVEVSVVVEGRHASARARLETAHPLTPDGSQIEDPVR
jgi:hypothetical protein